MKISKRSWIALSTLVGSAALGAFAMTGLPGGDTPEQGTEATSSEQPDADDSAAAPVPIVEGQLDSAPVAELDAAARIVRGNGPSSNESANQGYTSRIGDDDGFAGAGRISDEYPAASPPEAPYPSGGPADDDSYTASGTAEAQYQPESRFQPEALTQPASDYQPGDYQPNRLATTEYAAPEAPGFAPERAGDYAAAGTGIPADSLQPQNNSSEYTGPPAPAPYDPSGSYPPANPLEYAGSEAGGTTTPQMQAQYAPPYEGNPAFGSQPPVTPPPLSEMRQAAPSSAPMQTLAAPPAYPNEPPQTAGVETPLLVKELPGSRQLEGVQTPSIAVEKTGPEEIQINIPASFVTQLKNVGRATAHGVVLTDRVPSGTRLISTTPQAQIHDGLLVWNLKDLDPDEERTVSMEVMPEEEGEIGSVAQVTFNTQASVRSFCTKPMLTVEHQAPASVLIGEDVVFSITVSNPGTGAATGVVIEEDVPKGLEHAAGTLLESEIGTLQPGESRQMELVVKAAEAGLATNVVRIHGNGKLQHESTSVIEVVAPGLVLGITGPKLRYIERLVKYDVVFRNPGTAAARNVELTTYLPKGLEFRSADNKGQYDPRSHAIYWSLAELPPDGMGTVSVEAMPIEAGEQLVRAEGRANLGLVQTADHRTDVQSVTELEFSVEDVQDPIEVDSETIYEIRIVNNGGKSATMIEVAARMSEGIEALDAEGSTKVSVPRYDGSGQQIVMEPIAELPPRGEAVYRIRVKGRRKGDQVINVQLRSAEASTPVIKQEGTKVYEDR